MSDEPKKKDIKDFLNDFPESEMDQGSRDLLRESPIDWSVSKARALRMALGIGDEDLVNQIVDDVAHVLGKRRAEFWKITIMGKMVAEDLDRRDKEE